MDDDGSLGFLKIEPDANSSNKKKRHKDQSNENVKKEISPLVGWCKHCNSINLVNTILKTLPYEIKFKH